MERETQPRKYADGGGLYLIVVSARSIDAWLANVDLASIHVGDARRRWGDE